MIKNIAFVGYPVKDLKKARDFYEGILGFTPSEEYGTDGPWLEYNLGDTTFAIGCMEQWQPSEDKGPSAALEVDNIEDLAKDLKEKGVKFTWDVQDFPSCKMCIIHDPDGNLITLHQKK